MNAPVNVATVTEVVSDCGIRFAVSSFGMVVALTPCCGASGKGSDSPTGVVCRACYRPVPGLYGDGALIADAPRVEMLVARAHTGPRCTSSQACVRRTTNLMAAAS